MEVMDPLLRFIETIYTTYIPDNPFIYKICIYVYPIIHLYIRFAYIDIKLPFFPLINKKGNSLSSCFIEIFRE